jgi:hypothetical protein
MYCASLASTCTIPDGWRPIPFGHPLGPNITKPKRLSLIEITIVSQSLDPPGCNIRTCALKLSTEAPAWDTGNSGRFQVMGTVTRDPLARACSKYFLSRGWRDEAYVGWSVRAAPGARWVRAGGRTAYVTSLHVVKNNAVWATCGAMRGGVLPDPTWQQRPRIGARNVPTRRILGQGGPAALELESKRPRGASCYVGLR